MADLRMELLAEVGPKTHVADLCRRAMQELNMKAGRIAVLEQEIEMLRNAVTRYCDRSRMGTIEPMGVQQAVDRAFEHNKKEGQG